MASLQKITPYLWFNNQAGEAAAFYCSLFEDSRILSDNGMIVEFELAGMNFMALNGGPNFTFTEAVSFMIHCRDQQEVDYFWDRLTADGGQESMCSWCKDKYGLSWQVVPDRLMELLGSASGARGKKVMDTMLKMKKIVIKEL